MKTTTTEDARLSSYASSGNLWNAVSLTMTLSFAVSVLLLRDVNGFFDAEWRQQGFCISNADSALWTSHDMSFYVDVVLSVVLLALYWKWKDLPQMQGSYTSRMAQHAIGLIAHGVGHINIANEMRSGRIAMTGSEGFGVRSWLMLLLTVFFWFPLLFAVLNRTSTPAKMLVAFVCCIGQSQLPQRFAFTYVQTMLMVAFAFNELTKSKAEKQSYEYSVVGLIIAIPVVSVGWVESLCCTSFYKAIGGHLWYDASIGLALLNFYVLSYYRGPNSDTHDRKMQ